MKYLLSTAIPLLALAAGTVAQADLVLDLAFSDASTSKDVLSGSTVFVDMFLVDTDGSTPLAATGLVTGGGRLLQTAGTAALSSVSTVPGVNGPPEWFPPSLSFPAVPGLASVAVAAEPFVTVGLGSTAIHIARFGIEVAGGIGEVATITADVLGGSFIGNSTFGVTGPLPIPLDPLIDGFGSVAVTIVPEPSTFALAGLMLGGGMYAVRRKRKAQDEEAA